MLRIERRQIGVIAIACLVGTLTSLIVTGALLALNFLSTSVARAPIRAHVAQAFAAGELDDAWHLRTDTKRGAHQFNDCLIMLMVVDERMPPIQRSLSPLKAGIDQEGDAGPCARLRQFVANAPAPLDRNSPYHRYLHGHVALTAPLLAAFSLPNVRTLLDGTMFASLLGLFVLGGWQIHAGLGAANRGVDPLICKSKILRSLFGLTAATTLLIFFGLQFYGMSLSHFPSDILLVGYLYALMLFDFQSWPVWAAAAAHGVFGAVTAWLEFLTGGIPMSFCLIFFGYAAGALAAPSPQSVERSLAAAGAFAFGVAAAFALKMGLTVIVFGPAVIDDFAYELSYRIEGRNVRPWDVVPGLLSSSHYLGGGWRLLGAFLLAAPVAVFIAVMVRTISRAKTTSPPAHVILLALSALSIWGWWLVFSEHTVQHNFFMVRIGVGAIFSVAALAVCAYAVELRRLLLTLVKLLAPESALVAEPDVKSRIA